MTRLLLAAAAVISVLLALIIGAFRMQPPNAISDLSGCNTLCWRGIQPETTSKSAAMTQLTAATGVDPAQPDCLNTSSKPCELYRWTLPENHAVSTLIQMSDEKVESIAAEQPGFTVGALLLTMNDLHHGLYGLQGGFNSDSLDLWMLFADTGIGVSARLSCPTTYFMLLQTRVDTIVVQPPDPSAAHAPPTFEALRQTLDRLCGH